MDSDEIAGHLKSKHEITHKDYNSRFMNLIKEDKGKTTTKVVQQKTKNPAKKCVKKGSEKKAEEKPVRADNQKESSASLVVNEGSIEEKCTDYYDDFEAGPSSGQRLTESQRDENLEYLFKLQRSLLKKRFYEDDDDEEDDPVISRSI